MTTMTKGTSRIRREILEMAHAMNANGTLDDADFKKITLRDMKETPLAANPLSADEIRALREKAHMSQAAFAQHLNLTPGHISQLERGIKRPTGPALALLNIIRRKGIEGVL